MIKTKIKNLKQIKETRMLKALVHENLLSQTQWEIPLSHSRNLPFFHFSLVFQVYEKHFS